VSDIELTGFDEKVYRRVRQLNRHRERFIKAWCAHYRVAPDVIPNIQIVTRITADGDVMYMEWNPKVDVVAELVRAAQELREAMKRDSYTTDDKGERIPDAFRNFPEVHRIDEALKKLEGVK
jgi:hypothetical protein